MPLKNDLAIGKLASSLQEKDLPPSNSRSEGYLAQSAMTNSKPEESVMQKKEAQFRPKTRLLRRQSFDMNSADYREDLETTIEPVIDEKMIASLVVIGRPGQKRSFDLIDKFYRIGRGSSQDIQLLDDDSVSRENHALIGFDRQSQKFTVFDGGKVNPVLVNETVVQDSKYLESGDVIRIGETSLRLVCL